MSLKMRVTLRICRNLNSTCAALLTSESSLPTACSSPQGHQDIRLLECAKFILLVRHWSSIRDPTVSLQTGRLI